MSGLDESGIILSAMLEAEKEVVDPAVALLVAEDISEVLREKEKERNEIWKEKVAARKARMAARKGCAVNWTLTYTWSAPTCSHYYVYPTDDSTGSAYRW